MLGQSNPQSTSTLFYQIMDFKKGSKDGSLDASPSGTSSSHSSHTNSTKEGTSSHSKTVSASKHRKFYQNILLSTITLVLAYLLVKSRFQFSIQGIRKQISFPTLSKYTTRIRNCILDGQRTQVSPLPSLPNSRDDFEFDPIERFDVDGLRPSRFAIIGFIILVMGILIGA